jgi:hypothetical protein
MDPAQLYRNRAAHLRKLASAEKNVTVRQTAKSRRDRL